MHYSQPLEELGITLPEPLKKVCEQYETTLSVSKFAMHHPLAPDDWYIHLYILTRICRTCGQLDLDFDQTSGRRCLRHTWLTGERRILLVHGRGDTLKKALLEAADSAASFLENPLRTRWLVELFLERQDHIDHHRMRMLHSSFTEHPHLEELIFIYRHIRQREQRLLMEYARTLESINKRKIADVPIIGPPITPTKIELINEFHQPAIRESIQRFIDLFLELPRRDQKHLVDLAQTLVDTDRSHIVGGDPAGDEYS